MNIKKFFETIPKTVNKDIMNSIKDMIDSYVIRYNDYQIGSYAYELEDKFYTYLFVTNKTECRSNLLEKYFDKKTDCLKYHKELSKLCDEGNLDKISDLVVKGR
jgi:hypothetical protein